MYLANYTRCLVLYLPVYVLLCVFTKVILICHAFVERAFVNKIRTQSKGIKAFLDKKKYNKRADWIKHHYFEAEVGIKQSKTSFKFSFKKSALH